MPSCANCERRQEICIYQTWKQVSPGSTSGRYITEHGHTRKKSIDVPVKQLSPEGRISEVPLDLLFICRPVPKEGFDPLAPVVAGEAQLWRHALINSMAQHPYLQSCLSSISSMYTEQNEPCGKHVDRSCAYQDQIAASETFRSVIFTVNESNWIAVIVFSIALIMFQFASQQGSLGDYDYVETLYVLKMSAGISASVAPFLWRSKMWNFIQYRNKLESRLVDPHVWIALCNLRNTVASSVSHEVHQREVLNVTVQALANWALICDASPRTWRHYIIFPGLLSSEFLELLASEDDLALLILIYWCAIMRLGSSRWFLERWLSRTAAMAQAKLTGNWSHVLKWPNNVLGDCLVQ
jgi:hypothetical protein